MRWLDGYHQLSGRKSEQTPGDSEGQRSLACCSPGGRKQSDTTERLNNNNKSKWIVYRDWGQEEKGMTQDEMVGWHHQLNGHKSEQTPGDSEGQGSLVCCSP